MVLSGCTKTSEPVPPAEVKAVTAYGVTLDAQAGPQAVAYVLLKSIAADYAAAAAKDRKAQREAQLVTYSVAAPSQVELHLVSGVNQLNPGGQKSLGADRDQKLFKAVHYWGPIVGHYVPSFKDDTLETLTARSWVAVSPDGKTAQVYIPAAHNPAQPDPEKAETATIDLELAREQAGGESYWRVSRVMFLGRQFRAAMTPRIVQAYGLTIDGNAKPVQATAVALKSLAQIALAEQGPMRDVRASAIYRMFCLTDPARAAGQPAAADDADDSVAKRLGEVVVQWAAKVAPVANEIMTAGDLPAVLRETGAQQGTEVVFAPGNDPAKAVTVTLIQQRLGEVAFWRITNVRSAAATGATAAQSTPATQTR